MLEEKEITVTTQNGAEKIFIISKFPAVAGREIVCKYPTSGMPKIGDYAVNEETMLKLMSYVQAVSDKGIKTPLSTKTLVDNHVPDWETLSKIEIETMGYNCSFFQNGKISSFLDAFKEKAQQSISSTLMDLLGQLSQTAKQHSENSKQNTH